MTDSSNSTSDNPLGSKELREELADEREFTDSKVLSRVSDKDKHSKFVDLYIQYSVDDIHPSYHEMLRCVYKEAGFSMTNGKDVMYRAKKILAKNWENIQKETSKKLNHGAVLGAHTLIDLCKNAKQDSVRLKAAVELLNKGMITMRFKMLLIMIRQ